MSEPDSKPAPEPAPEAIPAPQAVRMAAVHLAGVQALRPGQRELELRFSAAGLQIFRLDTRAPVGTLPWSEIRTVGLPRRLSARPGPPGSRSPPRAAQLASPFPGSAPDRSGIT